MLDTLGGVLSTIRWTLVTYAAFMLFDLMAFNRIGMAVVYPDWMDAIEPWFWIKVAPRHIVMIPTAFLFQNLIRRHSVELSATAIACIALWVIWAVLLIWDSLRYYVFPIFRACQEGCWPITFVRADSQ